MGVAQVSSAVPQAGPPSPTLPHKGGGRLRLAAVIGLAALTAGCFQPLYGDRSLTGGTPVVDALRSIEVAQIDAPNGSPEARMAVMVRDQLLFAITGGAARNAPNHQLKIRLTSSNTAVIVDQFSGRVEVGSYRLTAVFDLVDIGTGKSVMTGNASTQVSYDAPGQQQRFARTRAQRDAEDRAAKVIAEDIRARLASFFVAGT